MLHTLPNEPVSAVDQFANEVVDAVQDLVLYGVPADLVEDLAQSVENEVLERLADAYYLAEEVLLEVVAEVMPDDGPAGSERRLDDALRRVRCGLDPIFRELTSPQPTCRWLRLRCDDAELAP